MERFGEEPVFLPAVVWGELMAGVHLADTTKRAIFRRKKLEGLKQRVVMLDFTAEVGEVWAEIFADMQRDGTPIPSNDLCVAATALLHGHTVLVGSKDEAHFRKIKNLKVQAF